MDFRSVLHHRRKVQAVQLGCCIRATSGPDRVNYPSTGGHPHNPGILHRTRNVDGEQLGSILWFRSLVDTAFPTSRIRSWSSSRM
ncbi:hypothetical protein GCM10017710_20160 [Arthrobacter ramosus]